MRVKMKTNERQRILKDITEIVYHGVMERIRLIIWLLAISLMVLQTSVVGGNWLWLVVAWWGARGDFLEIFLAGLALDLIGGTRLGVTSLEFLGGGLVVYFAARWVRQPDYGKFGF